MSKESSVPLTQTFDVEKNGQVEQVTVPLTQTFDVEKNGQVEQVTVPLRWRRYPVKRDVAALIGADEDSGHRVPPPSARRRRAVRPGT